MLHNFKINGGLYMLYLDYAKKKENGYILNFFADSYDDLEEVSDGKEYITLNGVNYGVPMAESVVTITNKNGEKTTYVMGGDGQWVQGDVDISNYYTKEQSDEKFATKESSVKVNVTSTTEENRYEFANIMVGTNIYELPDQPIFNYWGSEEELVEEDLDNIVIGPVKFNVPVVVSKDAKNVSVLQVGGTEYNVPVVVSEDGKNVSGLQVGNTKYNVTSGASGPEIVLLEGGKPTADVNGNYSLRLNTDLSYAEQGALTKRFRTGEVIIRIHCTDNTCSYTYDVNFIDDLSFTNGDNATGTWYVNFVVTDRETHKSTTVPCWVKYRD